MLHVLALVLGFVLLVWGADRFVEGASALARKLGIPSLIVGLTIVAFGTSAPELAVSLVASLRGANEIVIGNVVGSNIFNLLMVVGVSALVAPLTVDEELLHRDWTCSIIATALLGVFLFFDGQISRIDGIVLLTCFIMTIGMQIYAATKSKKVAAPQESETTVILNNTTIAVKIVLGLTAIIAGGQFAVNGATEIARIFQISETIIGLTIVAIGTSLPELVTSVVATRKGENSIAIGNVIGSNLFNILFILGISAVCSPIVVASTALYDTLLLLVISVLYWFIARKIKCGKIVGLSLVSIYAWYTVWIIAR